MLRIDLSAAIPLAAPFAMFVEPTNVCNFRCGICPESLPDYKEQAGYYGHMKAETWRRVVESLDGWCRLKVMRLYNTGEPLLAPMLPRMIQDAHRSAERVEVTTNGSLLDYQRCHELIAARLDYLRISVYGTTTELGRQEVGREYDLPSIMGAVSGLRTIRVDGKPHIHAELVTTHPGQEQAFHRQWDSIADTTSVKPMHNWGRTFVQLGSVPNQKYKSVCPYPFYELSVKANGEVTVCCVDWANELSVGNVNTESLCDIWHGERLRKLQQTHLEGRRSELGPCRNCNLLYACPDNLDSLVHRREPCA